MKFLLIALALLLVKAQAQDDDQHHPFLSYAFLKPASNFNDGDERILVLDGTDGITVLDNSCDGQRFRRCVQAYADDLGLEEIPKDSTSFVQKLTRIVQSEGLNGFKKECRAGKNLKNCFANQYDQCISEKYLKSIGVDGPDAKVFITLSVQMTYQCTTGLDTIIKNWDCIQRTEREHRRDLKRCMSDYARKVEDDPDNLCKYTQEMVNCYNMPYKQSCPPTVYGVLCHSMQIAITTSLPQCSIQCTKGSKDIKMDSTREGRTDTISTFLARVLTENIPLYQLGFRRQTWPIASPQCDDQKFKRCVNKFAKDIGLSSLPKRAQALAAYLNQLIATKKAAGFEQVCKAATNVGTCLGDQLESCFSVQHLEKLGIMTTDILIYRELRAGLASECGAGYDIIHNSIDCMINCGQQHQTEFTQCASDFEQNVRRDPSHACDYAQTFLRCYTDLLAQTCGADVGSATCDAMRAEISVPLFNCKNLTCQSRDDVLLIESSSSILAGRHHMAFIDSLAELPRSKLLRSRQETTPSPDIDSDEDDSSDDEDDTDDDVRPKCDDKKFGKCVNAYAKQLGLKKMPVDPVEFSRALHALLAKYGKLGFKKICGSGAKLATCVGPRQIATCMNVSHLIEMGLTQAQAYAYFTIFKALTFECTKGFKVIYENFDCIADVEHRQNATFVKCQQDFEKKAKQDPKNVCKYAQQYVKCDVKPFTDKCKPEVGSTICQVFQVVFKPFLPKCAIKCQREVEEIDIIVGGDEDIGVARMDEDQVADMIAS